HISATIAEANMARKLSAFFGTLVFLFCSVAVMNAQDSMKKDDHKAMSSSATATGCLQKGDEPNGFMLTGENGKAWELRSSKVNLSEHVGHKVTVTGSSAKASAEMEKKVGDSETKESGGKDHGDMKVTGLKMVSESCQ